MSLAKPLPDLYERVIIKSKRIALKVVSVFRIIRGVIMVISKLLVGGEIRCICWVTVVGRVFKYQFSLSGTRLHVLL